MKNWAIVRKSTNTVEQIYSSEDALTATEIKKKFGGPWSDLDICEHIEIPEDADTSALLELEVYDTEKETSTEWQTMKKQNGEDLYFDVFDSDGNPVYDDEGIQVKDVKYVEVSITVPTRSIRKK